MTSELVPWRGHHVPVIQASEISRYSLTDYFNWVMQAQGNLQAVTNVTYTQGKRAAEPIANNFAGFVEGLFYRDGPVAAVEWKRVEVFSQAAMLYQKREDGQFNKLYDDPSLDLLRTPWLGGSTASLMARALLFADLGGNAYIVRVDDELVVLRPDWVEIILEARMLGSSQVGWRKVGYAYHEGGLGNGDTAYLTVDEVAHFAPDPDPLASYRGMSWLTPIVREVMADKLAMDHKQAFFENSASPNLAVSLPKELTPQQFKDFVDLMDSKTSGVQNAGKTLYTGGGADVTVIGANMQQMDFAAVQGKGETRIANAGRVPAVVVGFSEGMQGSSLNAGNYQAAKRSFADTTCQYLWAAWCPALSVLFPPPNVGDRLWYNQRGIPYLNEDAHDVAEIQQMQAAVLSSLITSGFVPDSATDALTSDDMTKLKHSGLTSVQLLPPGSRDTDGDGSVDETAADDAAEDDYQKALSAARSWLDLADSIARARYNIRNPEGSVGGGRFRKLSAVIIQALEGWMNGEGDDDPLEQFEQPQLRTAAKDLGLVKDRERVSKPELKKRLLAKATADVHAQKHGTPAPKAVEAPKPDAPTPGNPSMSGVRELRAERRQRREAAGIGEHPTEAETLAVLNGLSVAQLRQLHEDLNVPYGNHRGGVPSGVSKPSLVSNLYDETTGHARRVFGDDSSGRLDLVDGALEIRPPKPKAAAKVAKAAPKPKAVRAPAVTVDEAESALAAATSRVDGQTAISGMQVKDLKALARRLQVDATSLNKAALTDALVEATVGTRVDARGIRSGGWSRPIVGPPGTGPNVKTKAGRNAFLADLIDEELAKDNPALDDTIGGIAASPREILTNMRDRLRAGDAATDFDNAFTPAFDHLSIRYSQGGRNKEADAIGKPITDTFTRISDKYRAAVPAQPRKADRRFRSPNTPLSSDTPPPKRPPIPERVKVELSPQAQQVMDAISPMDNPPSREQAHELVAGLPLADLRAMAKNLSVPGSGRMSAKNLRAEIVEATAGRRLDSISIRGFEGRRPALPHEIEAEIAGGSASEKVKAARGSDDVEAVAAKLQAGNLTEEEVLRLLSSDTLSSTGATFPGLSSAKLRKLADALGIDMPENMRAKTSMQMHIAQHVAGTPNRQREYDTAKLVAGATSDVEENAAKGASARALNHRLQAKLKALNIERVGDGYVWHRPSGDVTLTPGTTGDPDVDAARRLTELAADIERLTSEGASPDQLIEAARRHSSEQGLQPVHRAGDVVPFDRATQDVTGPKPAAGTPMLVIRPGYTLPADGGVVVERPLVMEAHDLSALAGLTVAEKRAKMRRWGWSDAQIDAVAPLLGSPGVTRAAGHDVTPGNDELHHYWTRGEGLAKWANSPHPWTTLRDHLAKHVSPGAADRMASAWFHEVFGIWSGERKGDNPVGPG